MKISIPKENRAGETRVAASPEVVKKFTAMGFEVTIESGAGLHAGFTDEIFKNAGAKIESDTKSTLENAYATATLVAASGNNGIPLGPCTICAVFYPAATTNDLSGNTIVVPAIVLTAHALLELSLSLFTSLSNCVHLKTYLRLADL